MLKLILHTLRFSGIAILLYVLLVIIWAEWDYKSFIRENIWYELKEAGIDSLGNVNSHGHMFSRMKEAGTIGDIDLLVIGSSQAYRGFDPRIFSKAGISIFNLGSSNQTPMQSDILLHEYIDRLKPETVFFIVYPEIFSVDGVESSLDLLANNKVGLRTIRLVLQQQNFKLINTMIYVLYRQLFNLNRNFKEQKQKGNDIYISSGYVEKKLALFGYYKYKKNMWDYNEKQFRVFRRSLCWLHKKGIKVILIQSPTVGPFCQSFTNNDVFDSLMDGLGTYYNFNNFISLDDSLYFYDQFHLNKNGVEIFDNKVLELLGDKIK